MIKKLQKVLYFILLLAGIMVEAQFATWTAGGSTTNRDGTGGLSTATSNAVGGVTATITAKNADTNAAISFLYPNNPTVSTATLCDGAPNNVVYTSLGNGTTAATQAQTVFFAGNNASTIGIRPTFTITFSAPVIINYLNFADADADITGGGPTGSFLWNEGFTITGTTFGTVDFGGYNGSPAATITTSSIALPTNYNQPDCNTFGVEYVRFRNSTATSSLTFTFPTNVDAKYLSKMAMSISYTAAPTCTGPSITTQPLSTQTVSQNATPTNLSVTATGGDPNLTYQWYLDTDTTPGGGSAISGATSAAYTPPTSAAGTRYYYVVVSNTCTSVTSTVSTVNVSYVCGGILTQTTNWSNTVAGTSTANASATSTAGTGTSAITVDFSSPANTNTGVQHLSVLSLAAGNGRLNQTDTTTSTGTVNTTNYFYSGTSLNGDVAQRIQIDFDNTPDTDLTNNGTRTITYTFSKPITSVLMNIDRLGGTFESPGGSGNFFSNSSEWTLASSGVSLTRLSGNPQFIVDGNKFYRLTGVSTTVAAGAENNGLATGAAQGTVLLSSATPFTTISFTTRLIGGEGTDPNTASDGLEILFEICAPSIVANNDSLSALGGGKTASVFGNDLLNGSTPTSTTVIASVVSGINTTLSGATINSDGTINVPAGTVAGTYTVEYQICQTPQPASGPNCAKAIATITVLLDSDGDGVPNEIDLDDDNDGIKDTDEGFTEICLNLSGISRTSPNISGVKNYVNGTTGFSVDVNGTYSTTLTSTQLPTVGGGIAPAGNSSGDLQFGSTGTSTEAQHMQYVLNFSTPVKVYIKPKASIVGNFDLADSWRFTASNGDVIPTTGLNPAALGYSASGPNDALVANTGTGGSNLTGWQLETTEAVNSITLKMWTDNGTDNVSPIRICILAPNDTDQDGIPNYLDLDSDNDGCPDAVEGGDNITAAMLNATGRINVAADGTTTPVVVDAQGVPVITNTGSTFNVDGQAQGQTVGQAYIVNSLNSGTLTATTPVCTGSTSTITVAGAQGASFQWQSSTDNVTFTNVGSATTTAPTSFTTPAITGTTYFRLVATSLGGCTSNSASVVINVRPLPTATISGGTTVCQNSTPAPLVTFTNAQGSAVTVTYNVNGGTAQTINVAANSSATVSASTATAGTFNYNLVSVAYQTAPTCSTSVSGTATIIVKANPTLTATSTNVSCSGESTGSVTLTAAGGTSPYTYSKDGTTYQSSNVFSNLPAGSYTFYVKDSFGCIGTTTATITQPTAITATVNAGTLLCNQVKSDLSVTPTVGSTADYEYQIVGADGSIQGWQNSPQFTNISQQSYKVYIRLRNNATSCTFLGTFTPENPCTSISKTADKTSVSAVGEIITYTITVSNTGNVDLTNLVITDAKIGFSQTVASFPRNTTLTYTKTYAVTQADLDNCSIPNTVTMTARTPQNNTITDSALNTVSVVSRSEFKITKTANTTSYTKAGDVINYTIVVENTGTVTISNVVLTDASATTLSAATESGVADGKLSPGEKFTYSATHTITTNEVVNACSFTNTATVTGIPSCGTLASVSASSTVNKSISAPTITNTIQPTCETPTGTITLGGLPSAGTWTVTASNGTTVTGTDTTTAVFNGLSAGSYTFTVSQPAGCSSAASVQVVLAAPANCACYELPTTTGTELSTKHGITLLKRAGNHDGDNNAANDWPMSRTGAWTVIESNTKGFVITRMTSDPALISASNHISKITVPVEGMMVYDTFEKCLKIYDGSGWKCFKTPACPNN